MLNSKFIFFLSLFICLLSLSTVSAIDSSNCSYQCFDEFDLKNSNSSIDYLQSNISDTNNQNYNFSVDITVNDFKRQNTFIVSDYGGFDSFIGVKNKELLLNFTVYDENGCLVKNGTKVSVYILSEEYNSNIINGKVTIPVKLNTTGKFAFEVRYFGNEFYKDSRNFTYLSIYNEEYESGLNNSENTSLINIGNLDSNVDIITFENFIYNGISRKLTFYIPKIVGLKGSLTEVKIYPRFSDNSFPKMNLTVCLFNGKKLIVPIINGVGKFNITLPNIAGNYSLFVIFNSSGTSNSSKRNDSSHNSSNNNINSFNKKFDCYSNGISMEKTSNPLLLLISVLSVLFTPILRNTCKYMRKTMIKLK